jgi:patatin-like phospholipase/acyl hydrolase
LTVADGGGIRGISELLILNVIMYRIRRVKKLSYEPLPADYFDLMCGTSTGGYVSQHPYSFVLAWY